jgi:hypothetical protein
MISSIMKTPGIKAPADYIEEVMSSVVPPRILWL